MDSGLESSFVTLAEPVKVMLRVVDLVIVGWEIECDAGVGSLFLWGCGPVGSCRFIYNMVDDRQCFSA